eukprot:CAMPEP_0182597792 /NCGR_PEP_ID=MMETSP1324-20130603/86996_1 /TAXON_ID=236786 /ORGANISM="Florenciella sp., Strain RCC1587" /LENGTH=32 /DNA_ID= /DNA_START= /DNA_END= /DNA_ORIENTATION=
MVQATADASRPQFNQVQIVALRVDELVAHPSN